MELLKGLGIGILLALLVLFIIFAYRYAWKSNMRNIIFSTNGMTVQVIGLIIGVFIAVWVMNPPLKATREIDISNNELTITLTYDKLDSRIPDVKCTIWEELEEIRDTDIEVETVEIVFWAVSPDGIGWVCFGRAEADMDTIRYNWSKIDINNLEEYVTIY